VKKSELPKKKKEGRKKRTSSSSSCSTHGLWRKMVIGENHHKTRETNMNFIKKIINGKKKAKDLAKINELMDNMDGVAIAGVIRTEGNDCSLICVAKEDHRKAAEVIASAVSGETASSANDRTGAFTLAYKIKPALDKAGIADIVYDKEYGEMLKQRKAEELSAESELETVLSEQ
jgi:hypothetical protein